LTDEPENRQRNQSAAAGIRADPPGCSVSVFAPGRGCGFLDDSAVHAGLPFHGGGGLWERPASRHIISSADTAITAGIDVAGKNASAGVRARVKRHSFGDIAFVFECRKSQPSSAYNRYRS